MYDISIHALREEGDDDARETLAAAIMISIHALREEGDQLLFGAAGHAADAFLSTPSARRATHADKVHAALRGISIHALREEGDLRWPILISAQKNFYPRPPRGGRRRERGDIMPISDISIHALREEGDEKTVKGLMASFVFLSTPSARRATTLGAIS